MSTPFQGFIPKLKGHILGRLLNCTYKGDTYGKFTSDKRNTICIAGECLYRCRTMHVNYTTYDIRREEDVINPKTYPNIMVKSSETGPQAQPYWYAHVIGIFHGLVSSLHPEVREQSLHHMDFLWVCWFGMEPGRYHYGFRCTRLPKIGFSVVAA